MQPCSYWKYDTLHAIVECGSAFFEDISKGMQILVNYPILLTYGGNIDVSFVLSSKGTLVCNSSSSVLVPNRTSPSLLHAFVAYTTQLSIAVHHTGNSFLHQHIPRKRLSASSCLVGVRKFRRVELEFSFFFSYRKHLDDGR